MAVANGYFDFSASGFGCQVRLPGLAVASLAVADGDFGYGFCG